MTGGTGGGESSQAAAAADPLARPVPQPAAAASSEDEGGGAATATAADPAAESSMRTSAATSAGEAVASCCGADGSTGGARAQAEGGGDASDDTAAVGPTIVEGRQKQERQRQRPRVRDRDASSREANRDGGGGQHDSIDAETAESAATRAPRVNDGAAHGSVDRVEAASASAAVPVHGDESAVPPAGAHANGPAHEDGGRQTKQGQLPSADGPSGSSDSAATTTAENAPAAAGAATAAPAASPASGPGQRPTKRPIQRPVQQPETQTQPQRQIRPRPQSQRINPFPKFEPFQTSAAPADGLNDDDDDEEEEDEDDFGDFNDGFDDEGRSDAFANKGLHHGLGRRGSGGGGGGGELTAARSSPPSSPTNARRSVLSIEDLEICQRLDEEYDRALEEREIGWTARYSSVRQSACFSLSFMLFYLVMGTIFFFRHTDWKLNESLVFSIYTITTVGYGNHDIPDSPGVQTFIVFYIFVGIATLTIMVAQVYQCVALEATRAQYSRDKAEIARSRHNKVVQLEMSSTHALAAAATAHHKGGMDSSRGSGDGVGGVGGSPSDDASFMVDFDEAYQRRSCCEQPWEGIYRRYESTKNFLRYTQLGRGVSILLPFAGLIGIGAVVVGPIEGWTFIESIYFAVVSLTTVGFGDYHPTKDASIWFCIFWLPFSVGFMSLYLGGVAHFYIQLSNSNIQRLERQMRRRIRRAKDWAEKERQEANSRLEAANAASRQRRQMRDVESGELREGEDDGGVAVSVAAAQDQASSSVVPSAASAAASPAKRSGKRRVGDYFQTLPTGDETDSDEEEVGGGVGGFAKHAANPGQPAGGGGTALFGSLDSMESMGTKRRSQVMTNAGLAAYADEGGEDGGLTAASSTAVGGDGKVRPRMPKGHTMATMKDVLSTIHAHMKRHEGVRGGNGSGKAESLTSIFAGDDSVLGPETSDPFMTSGGVSSSSTSSRSASSIFGKDKSKSERKPSFALRCLVQERVAEIVATEIAGYQSHVEIKDNTLSVTIASLKTTADKWMIPRRARKAFRAVAFEALYFVGEHGLITRGADSLYDLTPLEFHGLFGSFLASMGDADTMELWLDSTKMLAEVDLRRDASRRWVDGGTASASATRNLSGLGPDDRGGGARNSGVAIRRTSKKTERLNTVRARQMGSTSVSALGTSGHTFQPKVAGNAFSKSGKGGP